MRTVKRELLRDPQGGKAAKLLLVTGAVLMTVAIVVSVQSGETGVMTSTLILAPLVLVLIGVAETLPTRRNQAAALLRILSMICATIVVIMTIGPYFI